MENLKSGVKVTTKKDARFLGVKSIGVITGWVGFPKPNLVRVQWNDGGIVDYAPSKLQSILDVS